MIFVLTQNTAARRTLYTLGVEVFLPWESKNIHKAHIHKATNFQDKFLENLQGESLGNNLPTNFFYIDSIELFISKPHSFPLFHLCASQ